MKKIETLQDIFTINLDYVPDETYSFTSENNSEGHLIVRCKKKLSEKEIGLFDEIEIVLFSNASRNIIFSSFQNYQNKVFQVEYLIQCLYFLYGKDSLNNALLTTSEKHDLFQPTVYSMVTRLWSKPEDLFFKAQYNDISLSLIDVPTSRNLEIYNFQ